MQRVAIVGPPGSGKSTLACKLGARTSLPVTHIDQLFWSAGWVKTPTETYRAEIKRIMASPRWILDGVYKSTLETRLSRTDTIVFLDPPRRTYIWRIFKRTSLSLGRTRPDMAPNCPERLNLEFLNYIWTFGRDQRPILLSHLQKHPFIHLKTNADTVQFLDTITL